MPNKIADLCDPANWSESTAVGDEPDRAADSDGEVEVGGATATNALYNEFCETISMAYEAIPAIRNSVAEAPLYVGADEDRLNPAILASFYRHFRYLIEAKRFIKHMTQDGRHVVRSEWGNKVIPTPWVINVRYHYINQLMNDPMMLEDHTSWFGIYVDFVDQHKKDLGKLGLLNTLSGDISDKEKYKSHGERPRVAMSQDDFEAIAPRAREAVTRMKRIRAVTAVPSKVLGAREPFAGVLESSSEDPTTNPGTHGALHSFSDITVKPHHESIILFPSFIGEGDDPIRFSDESTSKLYKKFKNKIRRYDSSMRSHGLFLQMYGRHTGFTALLVKDVFEDLEGQEVLNDTASHDLGDVELQPTSTASEDSTLLPTHGKSLAATGYQAFDNPSEYSVDSAGTMTGARRQNVSRRTSPRFLSGTEEAPHIKVECVVLDQDTDYQFEEGHEHLAAYKVSYREKVRGRDGIYRTANQRVTTITNRGIFNRVGFMRDEYIPDYSKLNQVRRRLGGMPNFKRVKISGVFTPYHPLDPALSARIRKSIVPGKPGEIFQHYVSNRASGFAKRHSLAIRRIIGILLAIGIVVTLPSYYFSQVNMLEDEEAKQIDDVTDAAGNLSYTNILVLKSLLQGIYLVAHKLVEAQMIPLALIYVSFGLAVYTFIAEFTRRHNAFDTFAYGKTKSKPRRGRPVLADSFIKARSGVIIAYDHEYGDAWLVDFRAYQETLEKQTISPAQSPLIAGDDFYPPLRPSGYWDDPTTEVSLDDDAHKVLEAVNPSRPSQTERPTYYSVKADANEDFVAGLAEDCLPAKLNLIANNLDLLGELLGESSDRGRGKERAVESRPEHLFLVATPLEALRNDPNYHILRNPVPASAAAMNPHERKALHNAAKSLAEALGTLLGARSRDLSSDEYTLAEKAKIELDALAVELNGANVKRSVPRAKLFPVLRKAKAVPRKIHSLLDRAQDVSLTLEALIKVMEQRATDPKYIKSIRLLHRLNTVMKSLRELEDPNLIASQLQQALDLRRQLAQSLSVNHIAEIPIQIRTDGSLMFDDRAARRARQSYAARAIGWVSRSKDIDVGSTNTEAGSMSRLQEACDRLSDELKTLCDEVGKAEALYAVEGDDAHEGSVVTLGSIIDESTSGQSGLRQRRFGTQSLFPAVPTPSKKDASTTGAINAEMMGAYQQLGMGGDGSSE